MGYFRSHVGSRRSISRATSPDGYHWSRPVTIHAPDEHDPPTWHLYTPGIFKYRRGAQRLLHAHRRLRRRLPRHVRRVGGEPGRHRVASFPPALSGADFRRGGLGRRARHAHSRRRVHRGRDGSLLPGEHQAGTRQHGEAGHRRGFSGPRRLRGPESGDPRDSSHPPASDSGQPEPFLSQCRRRGRIHPGRACWTAFGTGFGGVLARRLPADPGQGKPAAGSLDRSGAVEAAPAQR